MFGWSSPAKVSALPRRQSFFSAGKRFFMAGSSDRLTSGWGTEPLTADMIIERNQRVLVAHSREQAMNNDYAKKFISMCVGNVIGHTGIKFTPQIRDKTGAMDTDANIAIEKAFLDWSKRKHCDIQGKKSFREIQKSCVRSLVRDGEFFLRFIKGKAAGKYRFALQIIDPQRCPLNYIRYDLDGGNFIRFGIEFNQFGKPVAYHFQEKSNIYDTYSYGGRDFVRVPAEEVCHGFIDDLGGAKRGLPWMATGLYRLRQLNKMEEAAIVNARSGAQKQGFFKPNDEYDGEDLNELDAEIESSPGEFQILPKGIDFEAYDPQYPNGDYAAFYKSCLRGVASGFGVAYNTLANDLEGVNFSSIRSGTLEERDNWKDVQEWMIESLCQPVFEVWAQIALLSGVVVTKSGIFPAGRIADVMDGEAWQGRRWEWIDPTKDTKASVEEKNNLITSPSAIIRAKGGSPDQVWRQSAEDVAKMLAAFKAEGIPDELAEKLIYVSLGMTIQDKITDASPSAGSGD